MADTYHDWYNDALGADNSFRNRVAAALTVHALFKMAAGQTPDPATKNLCARIMADPESMSHDFAIQVRSRLTSNQPFAADVSDSTLLGQVSVVFDCWILSGA